MCETHLKDEGEISIAGCTWYGHNRHNLASRAVHGSGGVGILVKNEILKDYDAAILDCSFEGILWLRLIDKGDINFYINICFAYLSPEGSSRCNIAQEFYDMLLSQVYMFYDENPMVIMGDLNRRIGKKQDFNPSIDVGDIPTRCVIDNTDNRYGNYLLDFLSDSKTCVLNGRFDQIRDNYTCVATRGRSVVDYIIVPHTHFDQIDDFEVKLVSECIDNYKLHIGSATQPDHSILQCKLNVSKYKDYHEKEQRTNLAYKTSKNELPNRKYDTKTIPIDIFTNERSARAIVRVIERLENVQNCQDELDNIYESFVDIVTTEMNEKLSYKVKTTTSSRKNGRGNKKHWWNNELT